jgi:predicted RNA binding protein YcfA (HicA-like mRNA interferase family)
VKIPRNLNGTALVKALRVLGYERVRQDGSHMRLSTTVNGTHHVTVPAHKPLKIGTLSSILKSIAAHHQMTLEELLEMLGF